MSDSSIRRRDFVAGATAIATGLALSSDAQASGKTSPFDLTHTDFAQMIGQSFAVDGVGEQGRRQRGTLVLKEVIPHDTAKDIDRPSHLRKEGFSLEFESQDSALPSGTHSVTVSGFRPHSIFIHEMVDQRNPGRRHYEAVFN